MKLGFLFNRSPSILIAIDKVAPQDSEEVLDQVSEIRKYYRFATVPEFIHHRGNGRAMLVFENPRKGAFLHLLPVLIAEKVPFTLFLRPECIGTNRLPEGEERQVYREEYPDLSDSEFSLKPFPVHKTNPLDYFVTWGKIREFPPSSFDIGMNLYGRAIVEMELKEDLAFIEKQVQRRVEVALLPSPHIGQILPSVGIRAVVTAREGVIDASTSPFDLPRYRIEKND